MKTIHKYQLRTGANRALLMPKDAHVLSVQNQREQLALWAEVDLDNDEEARTFHVVYTGTPLPSRIKTDFIGTVQFANGELVCHVYEELR